MSKSFQQPMLQIGSEVSYLGRDFTVQAIDFGHVTLKDDKGTKAQVSQPVLQVELENRQK